MQIQIAVKLVWKLSSKELKSNKLRNDIYSGLRNENLIEDDYIFQ